ncbi:unnamed protein product [Kuraishia capsulata CBS 1993]|uniref:Elongation factor 1-gamma 1 n=1 Tax=Kuraishia capsulata CBS 1993 TaxID=1382522 RepID=W6MLM1_9ASCO|nr:uncharacterized protein KUCA_T00003374001 [Kuraishia capsulata CBS 1993]CDK27396.1 unnamed protein product [Kuraishia capsulata CBS 1993]
MSLGTLYGKPATRTIAPVGLVKALGLDVKIIDTPYENDVDFPLKKYPGFITSKNVKLFEVTAIVYYLIKSHDVNSPLLGKTDLELAEILKWISLANTEFMTASCASFFPSAGRAPYNKKVVDEGNATLALILSVLETRLSEFTYLVGERLTIADIIFASYFLRPLEYIWDKAFIAKHPVVFRWWKTVVATPFLNWKFADIKFLDAPVEPPKASKKAPKADKASAPKAAKPAAAAAAAPAAEAPTEQKKAPHPLAALGKPTIELDEWKRHYSNDDTRPVALPYFWNEFYNPAEWSLWKVGYKYNDELTLTFMSNNLVGGFFARLSASTKFLFGCMVVYGENNANGIVGAFLVRGQEFAPAFDVAPDWESYSFEKLDGSKEEDKAFINNMWAWDEPVVVDGVKKEIADGKVFK